MAVAALVQTQGTRGDWLVTAPHPSLRVFTTFFASPTVDRWTRRYRTGILELQFQRLALDLIFSNKDLEKYAWTRADNMTNHNRGILDWKSVWNAWWRCPKVGPEFPFRTSYDHLAKRTTILDCGGTNKLILEKANDDVINYDVTEAAIVVEGSAQSGMQNQDQDAKGGKILFPELSQNIQGHVRMVSKLPKSDDWLLIYEKENKPCFSLELSHIQFIN
jgi:hypothetical protein